MRVQMMSIPFGKNSGSSGRVTPSKGTMKVLLQEPNPFLEQTELGLSPFRPNLVNLLLQNKLHKWKDVRVRKCSNKAKKWWQFLFWKKIEMLFIKTAFRGSSFVNIIKFSLSVCVCLCACVCVRVCNGMPSYILSIIQVLINVCMNMWFNSCFRLDFEKK